VDLNVTTAMCPKSRVVIYGVTYVVPGSGVKPEVIADSLGLKLKHCRGKTVSTLKSALLTQICPGGF
jgi:hypothetical protein